MCLWTDSPAQENPKFSQIYSSSIQIVCVCGSIESKRIFYDVYLVPVVVTKINIYNSQKVNYIDSDFITIYILSFRFLCADTGRSDRRTRTHVSVRYKFHSRFSLPHIPNYCSAFFSLGCFHFWFLTHSSINILMHVKFGFIVDRGFLGMWTKGDWKNLVHYSLGSCIRILHVNIFGSLTQIEVLRFLCLLLHNIGYGVVVHESILRVIVVLLNSSIFFSSHFFGKIPSTRKLIIWMGNLHIF